MNNLKKLSAITFSQHVLFRLCYTQYRKDSSWVNTMVMSETRNFRCLMVEYYGLVDAELQKTIRIVDLKPYLFHVFGYYYQEHAFTILYIFEQFMNAMVTIIQRKGDLYFYRVSLAFDHEHLQDCEAIINRNFAKLYKSTQSPTLSIRSSSLIERSASALHRCCTKLFKYVTLNPSLHQLFLYFP